MKRAGAAEVRLSPLLKSPVVYRVSERICQLRQRALLPPCKCLKRANRNAGDAGDDEEPAAEQDADAVFQRDENEDEAKYASKERGDVRLASLVQEGGGERYDARDEVVEVLDRAVDVLAEDVDAKRHLQGADVDEAVQPVHRQEEADDEHRARDDAREREDAAQAACKRAERGAAANRRGRKRGPGALRGHGAGYLTGRRSAGLLDGRAARGANLGAVLVLGAALGTKHDAFLSVRPAATCAGAASAVDFPYSPIMPFHGDNLSSEMKSLRKRATPKSRPETIGCCLSNAAAGQAISCRRDRRAYRRDPR